MTTITASGVQAKAGLGTILAAAFAGALLVFLAGFAHSQTLHDAAHDVRHATGFPCH